MITDSVKENLRARIELLKLYVIIVIGLITGISSLLLKEEKNSFVIGLIIVGNIFLLGFSILSARTYLKISNIIKSLDQ